MVRRPRSRRAATVAASRWPPEHRSTSASARRCVPSVSVTPVARPLSTSIRRTCAPYRIVRFDRPPVRREIGHRRRRPPRALLRQLVVGDTVLCFTVDVHVARDTKGRRGLEIGLADRQGGGGLRHAQRATLAVERVVPGVVVLGLAEIGQHVVIGPALAAHLPPFVIVERIAARVDLRVDRRSAADHLGLRVGEDLAAHVPLRHRAPAPGRDTLGHLGEARRQVKQRVPVAPPRPPAGRRGRPDPRSAVRPERCPRCRRR